MHRNIFFCHTFSICIWRQQNLEKAFFTWQPHKKRLHWARQKIPISHFQQLALGVRKHNVNTGVLSSLPSLPLAVTGELGLAELQHWSHICFWKRQKPWSIFSCQEVTYLPKMKNVFFLLEYSQLSKTDIYLTVLFLVHFLSFFTGNIAVCFSYTLNQK